MVSSARLPFLTKGPCVKGETAVVFSQLDQGDVDPDTIQAALEICDTVCHVRQKCESTYSRVYRSLGDLGTTQTVLNGQVIEPAAVPSVAQRDAPLTDESVLPVPTGGKLLPGDFLDTFIAAGPDNYMGAVRAYNNQLFPKKGIEVLHGRVSLLFHEQFEARDMVAGMPEGIARSDRHAVIMTAVGLFCRIRHAMHLSEHPSWDTRLGAELSVLAPMSGQYFGDVAAINKAGLPRARHTAQRYGGQEAAAMTTLAQEAPGLTTKIIGKLLMKPDAASRLERIAEWSRNIHYRLPVIPQADITQAIEAKLIEHDDFKAGEAWLIQYTATPRTRKRR